MNIFIKGWLNHPEVAPKLLRPHQTMQAHKMYPGECHQGSQASWQILCALKQCLIEYVLIIV